MPHLPEHREGEPLRQRARTVPFAVQVAALAVFDLLLFGVALALLPVFLVGLALWGWPPARPRMGTAWRHLRTAFTAHPPAPGLRPLSRVWLALRVVQKVLGTPVWGVAWYLDELLFGRVLDAHPVRQPLVMLSAARSGSTQLSHYLESDPTLAAPAMLQIVFPYLWLWHIVVPVLGRFMTAESIGARFDAHIPIEMKQRHEGHPLRTDTFEVLWLLQGTVFLTFMMGPETMRQDAVFMGTADHNRHAWDVDFVRFLDRVGRKALAYAGADADGAPRRLYVKGHFLEARHAVARHWPDARFLTMVRDPVQRIESAINHAHANLIEEALGAPRWSWITPVYADSERLYCEVEQAWYSAEAGPHRTVVRFRDYVDDLEGTMRRVYARCLDLDTLPPHVPRVHAPRERKNYVVHRTLEDLQVDRAALTEALHGYRVWCGSEPEA